ncbi:uncharacterized protein LOC142662571 [Rhinoderma darwinii]|uniref:uncharacterized protein LOC142662571 n=1 Tax=Rhinoderma darwinii TaxID=43563 RepID=UPI003F6771C5
MNSESEFRGTEMSEEAYHRMHLNVGKLIHELKSHPCLWDKGAAGGICEKRWRSVRDRFMKVVRKAKRSGGSPVKRPKVPHHDDLLFILPSRGQRPTEGNFQEPEAPATQDEQQQMEREPTPSTSTQHEAEGEEQLAGDLVATDMPLGEETPVSSPLPVSHLDAPPVATQVSDPAPHTCNSSRRGRRRTRRVRNRQLVVQTESMSLIQRVDGDDKFDLFIFFGYALASSCRQMPTERQDHFIAFCHTVAADFPNAPALPELSVLLIHFRQAVQLHQAQLSGAVSTTTQSQPLTAPAPYPAPPLPTAGGQFFHSFYPYHPTSSGPQPTCSNPSTHPRYYNLKFSCWRWWTCFWFADICEIGVNYGGWVIRDPLIAVFFFLGFITNLNVKV